MSSVKVYEFRPWLVSWNTNVEFLFVMLIHILVRYSWFTVDSLLSLELHVFWYLVFTPDE
jgi:hypothetical protein